MSPEDFVGKWASESRTMHQRDALVSGAALLEEVLRDFEAVTRSQADELLNLTEASRESGYSTDYLGTLV